MRTDEPRSEAAQDEAGGDQAPMPGEAPVSRSAPLSLRRGERRWLLMLGDLAALAGALVFYLVQRGDPEGLGVAIGTPLGWGLLLERPHWFVLLGAIWLVVAHAFDAYRLQVANRFVTSAAAVLRAATATLAIYLLVPFLTPTLPTSRRYWLILFGSVYAALLLVRGLYAMALGGSYFRRPTLIVGAGWAGQAIAQALLQHDDGSYRIVGFIDDDADKLGKRVGIRPLDAQAAPVTPIDTSAFTVLGDRGRLRELIARHRARTLVLAITDELDPDLYRVLTDCLELGVEIVPMSRLYERLTGRVPVEHVGEDWHMAMPLEHPGTGTLHPMLKRAFDLAAAGFGLLLLLPFVPFIAAAICLESPGPVFYTQERVGKGGRVFRVFKFRSMQPDAEEGTAVWSKQGDPRITHVGRILRATHVDEFPQFVNILRGEMSAVGPRPERPEFLRELTAEIPFYAVRHAVKPGMAGWALVHCGYGSSKEETVRKLQYDLYYIKHQSVLLDIVIILKTVLHSVGLQGR